MAVVSSTIIPNNFVAPDFNLPDTEGKFWGLKDFIGKKGLVVAFTCNHCPYAKAAWPLLIDLYQKYKDNIGFVGINPNDAVTYPEDSFEEMKKKKQEWGIPFPYLRDETQEVAKSYNAQCTPDIYLFKWVDNQWKLFYHGRINDNWQRADLVTENNLADAIERLLNNQPAPEIQPPSMGCSIKWKSRGSE